MITHVWSSFGHRFMATSYGRNEECLTCGAMFELLPREDDETGGDYIASDGSDSMPCTGDTSMVHGYPGERWCDECDAHESCAHVEHDCNCLFCE